MFFTLEGVVLPCIDNGYTRTVKYKESLNNLIYRKKALKLCDIKLISVSFNFPFPMRTVNGWLYRGLLANNIIELIDNVCDTWTSQSVPSKISDTFKPGTQRVKDIYRMKWPSNICEVRHVSDKITARQIHL